MIYNQGNSIAEKTLRKFIALIVVMAFLIPVMTPKVFASSDISISGGDGVKGGETFTVTVTYGGGNIGRVNGQMTYDTNKLTYISGGSSSGNAGIIELKDFGNGTVTFKIKFQAVAEGSTELNVTTYEMYSENDEYLDNPSGTKTINISGNADSEELITETRSSEEPVDNTTVEGVDEKEEPEDKSNTTAVLIISAAVLAVVICIIAAVLIRKKRR